MMCVKLLLEQINSLVKKDLGGAEVWLRQRGVCLPSVKPWAQLTAPHETHLVAQAGKLSTWEAGPGGLEVHSHPHSTGDSKAEAGLGYRRPCITNTKLN